MIEVFPIPAEAEDMALTIADGVEKWVHQECITSISDHNRYLDSLEDGRRWLAMSCDDPTNMPIAKHDGHRNRQRIWGDLLVLEPENDYVAGRHIFNLLMEASGAAKRMCYLAATDQEHYIKLKSSPTVLGIEPYTVVIDSMRKAQVDNGLRVNDASEIQAITLRTFADVRQDFDALRERVETDYDQPESPTMNKLRDIQTKWVRLVTNSILSSMAYRGGLLERVPVLEPKSISDEPAVFYPFTEAA